MDEWRPSGSGSNPGYGSTHPRFWSHSSPGVTEEELQAAEGELQVTLPETVRDFYRIHDGQATDRYGYTAQKFLYGWEAPNLKRVVQQWKKLEGSARAGSVPGHRECT